MAGTDEGRAVVLAGVLVLAMVSGLFGVSYLLSYLLPRSIALPGAARIVGGAVFAGGVVLAGWTFRYRDPRSMAVSTYSTVVKALSRTSLSEMGVRKEKLVVDGPQRYVRSPLYLAIISIMFGWGVATLSAFFLVAAATFLVWFSLVLIPFEERELAALFGEEWTKYSEVTPMLIPFTKRKTRASVGSGLPSKR